MRNRDSLRRWCAQPQEDDGVDPRQYFRKYARSSDNRKTRQLCRQAFRVLSLAFSPEGHGSELRDLSVIGVLPGPDASRIVVQIGCPHILSLDDQHKVLSALTRLKGRLRSELAQAVTRRRIPDLDFQLVFAGGAES